MLAYNSGALYIYKDGAANTLISGNGNSYLMGGNVGIRTTAPGAKLDVFGGNVRVSQSGANGGVLGNLRSGATFKGAVGILNISGR